MWPRFKESVEAQIASVRDAAFTVVVSTSMSEIRLFTQRYAHLRCVYVSERDSHIYSCMYIYMYNLFIALLPKKKFNPFFVLV